MMNNSTIYFHDELKIVFRRQIHEMMVAQLVMTTQILHHIVRDHPGALMLIVTN